MQVDRNITALQSFYVNELQREREQVKTTPRKLLKLVGTGENRHLEVAKDGLIERVRILFSKLTGTDYNLDHILRFVNEKVRNPINELLVAPAIAKIEGKIGLISATPAAPAPAPIPPKAEPVPPHLPLQPAPTSMPPTAEPIATPTSLKSVPTPIPPTAEPVPAYLTHVNVFLDKLLTLETAPREEVFAFRQDLTAFQELAKKHPELQSLSDEATKIYESKKRDVQRPSIPGINISNIRPQKEDGNCLLRSFAVAFGKDPDKAHLEYRAMAAAWMEDENRWKMNEKLRGMIISAIPDHNRDEKRKYDDMFPFLDQVVNPKQGAIFDFGAAEKASAKKQLEELEKNYKELIIPQSLSEDEQIQRYIQLSKKERFFCDAPQIYALSHLFNVSIEVYRTVTKEGAPPALEWDSNGGRIVKNPSSVIRLHFDDNGKHYNAILTELPPPPPAATVPSPIEEPGEIEVLTDMLTKLTLSSPADLEPYRAELEHLQKVHQNNPKQKESLETAKAILRSKTAVAAAPTPESVSGYGRGIANGSNACYINASLQGLRFLEHTFKSWLAEQQRTLPTDAQNPLMKVKDFPASERYLIWTSVIDSRDIPSIEERRHKLDTDLLLPTLQSQERERIIDALLDMSYKTVAEREQLFKDPLLFEVQRLFNLISGTAAQDVDEPTIKAFRQMMRLSGLDVPVEWVQQDTCEFLSQLLSCIGVAKFEYRSEEKYFTADHITFGLGMGHTGSIQELVGVGSERIAYRETSQLPQFIPIRLNRFAFEDRGRKVQTLVDPSPYLDIAIESDSTKTARYRLKAVAVHERDSLEAGHFVTYVPVGKEDPGSEWIKFDDKVVTRYKSDDLLWRGWEEQRSTITEIQKNGYVYFYEFEGTLERKSA